MPKKILFCGGGTLGPVTPLLAIIEAWRRKDSSAEFVFVGTPHGPERELIEKEGIEFHCLPVAKLVRYPSFEWLWLPVRLATAFYVALKILKKEQPGLIVSAGGYTAVPMIIVGWLLGVPSMIHQQDVRPLLSNQLTAPFASLITLAWRESLVGFPKNKTKFIGNPARSSFDLKSREVGIKHFKLDSSKPTVLVLGGGTGSLWLNKMFVELGSELAQKANVIHVTGKGKMTEYLKNISSDYKVFELLVEDMPLAFAVADLVVCRAGMGTITELAATHKPSIIIPLPNSPQEANAEVLEKHQAAIIVEQEKTDSTGLLFVIENLLSDEARRRQIGENVFAVLKTEVADELVKEGQRVLNI